MFLAGKLRERIWFKLRRNIIETLKAQDSERLVAFSFALGTLISTFPTPGFSAIIAALVAITFKKLNKFAMLTSLIIWNTFTLLPLYWLATEIGAFIFGPFETVLFEYALLNTVYHFTKHFLVGGVIVTVPFALLNYSLILFLVRKIKNRKASQPAINFSR